MLNQTGTTSAGSSHPPTLQSVNRSAALAILGSCMQTHSDFGQLRRSLITATTAPALSRSEPRLGVFLLPMPMQAFIDTASPCRRCDSGLRAHPDFPPPPCVLLPSFGFLCCSDRRSSSCCCARSTQGLCPKWNLSQTRSPHFELMYTDICRPPVKRYVVLHVSYAVQTPPALHPSFSVNMSPPSLSYPTPCDSTGVFLHPAQWAPHYTCTSCCVPSTTRLQTQRPPWEWIAQSVASPYVSPHICAARFFVPDRLVPRGIRLGAHSGTP